MGNVFALLVDAVLGDKGERLRLHSRLLQKAHIFHVVVCRNELAHLLHLALQFLVEIGVLLIVRLFGFACRCLDGQILHGKGGTGNDVHQIVVLPKRERGNDIFLGGFEHLCHRRNAKISVCIFAKVKPVKVNLYGKTVCFGQVFGDKLAFDGYERIFVAVLGKRAKGHTSTSVWCLSRKNRVKKIF